MIVWLYQKRMILKDVDQKIFRCIYYNHYTLSVQSCHNLFIHIIRHGGWNTSRQEKHIALSQCIQLLHQLFYFFFPDHRSCTVDLCPVNGFQLYIDSGNSVSDLNEI